MKPDWLLRAESYLGLKEIPGPASSPVIIRWMSRLRVAWLGGDDVPWCGTALANWMLEAGYAPPAQPYRALNWASWGETLAGPVYGCVGVMRRDGGGHVTLIVGVDKHGNMLGLGGNQSDGVRVSAFPRGSFLSFRWPTKPGVTLAMRNQRSAYVAIGLPTSAAATETRVT